MGETDKARHGLDLFNYAKAPACRLKPGEVVTMATRVKPILPV